MKLAADPSPRDASTAFPRSSELERAMRDEFPGFRIRSKQGDALSRWVDRALKLVTFGGQGRYLTEYHTVLGWTLYVAPTWQGMSDLERFVLLRHERVHLRQRRRYGSLLMAFLYLVPFFPLGLAYGRARLEWEAYVETLRATAECFGLDAARAPALRAHILRRFMSADYGWMWPFERAVGAWYDRALHEIASSGSAPAA